VEKEILTRKKGSNFVRKAVHNHDPKNCNSFSATDVKVRGLSREVPPSKIENKLVSSLLGIPKKG
jgi:hypothetical protein